MRRDLKRVRLVNVLNTKGDCYCKIIGLYKSGIRIRIKPQRNPVGSLGRNLVHNFNKNLTWLPSELIDYVVVQELFHTRVPNRSSRYWHLMSSITPDHKGRKRSLESNRELIIT
jgi:predicted metal-dependent hydrolase